MVAETVPEIVLIVLKNTYRDGIFTKTIPFGPTTDTEAVVGAVHKEDFAQLLWQLRNTGATNGVDFMFYAMAEDDESHGTEKPYDAPPDFDPAAHGVWFEVPNFTATVDAEETDARIITDNWTWVLVTVISTVAASPTSGTIYIRGE